MEGERIDDENAVGLLPRFVSRRKIEELLTESIVNI